MISQRSSKGFSLIEVMMVIVIVGLLAAVAVPSMKKSRDAANKGATVAVLRTMHTDQLQYFAKNSRFGRLAELNTEFGGTFGTTIGNRIYRGNYFFVMTPSPTATSLETNYQVVAYRTDNRIYYPSFVMNQSGSIQALLP